MKEHVEISSESYGRLNEFPASIAYQELKCYGNEDEVAEGDSAEKKRYGKGQEYEDITPFMLVEASRNEQPRLVQYEGRCDDNRADEADFHEVEETFWVFEDDKFRHGSRGLSGSTVRKADDLDELTLKEQTYDKGNGDGHAAKDDAFAKLFQVVAERHSGVVGFQATPSPGLDVEDLYCLSYTLYPDVPNRFEIDTRTQFVVQGYARVRIG